MKMIRRPRRRNRLFVEHADNDEYDSQVLPLGLKEIFAEIPMPRDWKLIAKGTAPEIPEAEMENAVAVLRALETEFVPLLLRLPHETEPAVIFPPFPAPEELA